MAARQGATSFGDPATLFDLAADLCAHSVALDPIFFQEAASLHWIAVLERALCYRDAGQTEEALRDLDWILSEDPTSVPPGCSPASAEIRMRAIAEQRGLAYRCFKELVNEGRVVEARSYGERLAQGIVQSFGYDPLDAVTVRAKTAGVADLRDYGQQLGFVTPCFVFYAAMAARQGATSFGDPAILFDLAADLCAHCVAIDLVFFEEAASLHWVAVLERALCSRDAGKTEEALRDLDWILSEDPTSVPPGCGPASAELRMRAITERRILAPDAVEPPIPETTVASPRSARIAARIRPMVPVSLQAIARRVRHMLRR
jgi:hypothetical protein